MTIIATPIATGYGGSPSTDTTDAIRLLVGDTATTSPLLSNAEIDYFYTTYGNIILAASYVAGAIAAKYATQVSNSFGDGSAQLDQLFQHYTAKAKELLDQYHRTLNSFVVPGATDIGVIYDSLASNYPSRQHLSDITPQDFGTNEE